MASEVLLVNHLYSDLVLLPKVSCGSAGWVSNTTRYDCCHHRHMQECNPFGQPAHQIVSPSCSRMEWTLVTYKCLYCRITRALCMRCLMTRPSSALPSCPWLILATPKPTSMPTSNFLDPRIFSIRGRGMFANWQEMSIPILLDDYSE